VKKIAVVTGGAGFIGSHLVEALLAEEYEVRVVDDLSGGRRDRLPEAVQFFKLDVCDTAKLAPAFSGADYVFHLAALPRVPFSIEHPRESHTVNVDGTLSVLIAARDAKVGRVIFAASASAYGNQEVLPLTEDLPARPANPYGLQKYMSELYVRHFFEVYGLPSVSLRYFNVYGPRLDPEGPYALAIGKFLALRKRGEPLTIVGDGTQTRDFTHVRDIARASVLAATSLSVGKGEVINIGTGRNKSVNYLADLFGGERVHLPPRIEAHDSRADNRKAKELLGWEPTVTLEEGIAELKREFKIV
jgi:UDP-glucose 4-epimerase